MMTCLLAKEARLYCYKYMKKIDVKRGKKKNSLKIIREVSSENYNHSGKKYIIRYIECRCDCGNKTIIKLSGFRNGHTKSCGCLKIKNRKMDVKKACTLRSDGKTYQYIADYFGVSKQLIWAKLNDYTNTGYKLKYNADLYESIKKRDNYQCQMRIKCNGCSNNLNIHHIDHVRDNDSKNNLMTACAICHSSYHASKMHKSNLTH